MSIFVSNGHSAVVGKCCIFTTALSTFEIVNPVFFNSLFPFSIQPGVSFRSVRTFSIIRLLSSDKSCFMFCMVSCVHFAKHVQACDSLGLGKFIMVISKCAAFQGGISRLRIPQTKIIICGSSSHDTKVSRIRDERILFPFRFDAGSR